MPKEFRGHPPVVIDQFNGLWRRGNADTAPLDHFTDCNNIQFVSDNTIRTRPGIGISQDVDVPLENVKRIYNYNNQETNGLLALTYDEDDGEGSIWHVVSDSLTYGPILVVADMRDFAFQPYGGRAYISPFNKSLPVLAVPGAAPGVVAVAGAGVTAGLHNYAFSFVNAQGETKVSDIAEVTTSGGNLQVNVTGILTGGAEVTARKLYRSKVGFPDDLFLVTTIADNTTTTYTDNTADAALTDPEPGENTATSGTVEVEKGLQNEVVYVYMGQGVEAREAAGPPLSGDMTIANGAAGNTDPGLHVFGFVAETDSGFLTAPGLLETFTTAAAFSVSFGSVSASGDPSVIKRHLVASKVITNYNGNVEGYQLFFVPNATINNNTDLFLNDISFFDQDLLDDASHLLDNYEEIPAGAVLSLYHERLIVGATFDDINLVLASATGEPEAISQIDGIIGVQPDGNPITNAQELRDVLYIFKRTRCISFNDNEDEPATWLPYIIDNALGTCVHGIATVLDSGSSSVDYLIVCTYQGVTMFNGKFIDPPLTWKVESFWKDLDREEFGKIQIVNAPVQEELYIVLTDRTMLGGNYATGMTHKEMAWCPWTFPMGVNTVAIANIDEIVIGADIP